MKVIVLLVYIIGLFDRVNFIFVNINVGFCKMFYRWYFSNCIYVLNLDIFDMYIKCWVVCLNGKCNIYL